MRSRGVRVRTAFAAMTALAVSVVGGCSLLVSTDSKALTDVAIDDRLATYPVSLGIGLRYVQVNADTASVNLDDLVFDYE